MRLWWLLLSVLVGHAYEHRARLYCGADTRTASAEAATQSFCITSVSNSQSFCGTERAVDTNVRGPWSIQFTDTTGFSTITGVRVVWNNAWVCLGAFSFTAHLNNVFSGPVTSTSTQCVCGYTIDQRTTIFGNIASFNMGGTCTSNGYHRNQVLTLCRSQHHWPFRGWLAFRPVVHTGSSRRVPCPCLCNRISVVHRFDLCSRAVWLPGQYRCSFDKSRPLLRHSYLPYPHCQRCRCLCSSYRPYAHCGPGVWQLLRKFQFCDVPSNRQRREL